MASTIRVRTALDKAYRPLGGEFLTTVLVELTPPRSLRRLPLNLAILVDCSESMGGEKLDQARQACRSLLDSLDPDDLVSVVAFHSQARVLIDAQHPVGDLRVRADQLLAGLRAEGVTSLLRALDEGYKVVRRQAGADRTTFVILLSDGFPTTAQGYVDDHLEPYVRRVDREMREWSFSLSTIGLGDAAHYDPAFLRRLADSGNGQFLYCPAPSDLGRQFAGELERIQRTVLAEVSLTVKHVAGTIRRLWRVFPDKKLFDAPEVTDGTFSVPLGSFQEDQPQAFLIDVVTSDAPDGQPARCRLFEVETVWRSEGEQRTASAPVLFEYTDNQRALAQRNPEVVRLATECLDAMLEEQLETAVATGDRARQTAVLARKKQLTKKLGKAEATQVLEEMEEALDKGDLITPDALARSSQATKPTQRLG